MKTISKIVLITITLFILTSCKSKKYDYSNLEDIPYFEYLKETNPLVEIKVKDFGVIKLELFVEEVKLTADNFLSYVIENEYNGSSFHRIIKNFMIQGGIVKNTKSPIKGEFNSNGVTNNIKHYRGIISMARTMDPNSATSQFFIVDKTSPHLNNEYAAFGGLVEGFDVLDNIASVKTNFADAPLKEVIIEYIIVDLRGYKI